MTGADSIKNSTLVLAYQAMLKLLTFQVLLLSKDPTRRPQLSYFEILISFKNAVETFHIDSGWNGHRKRYLSYIKFFIKVY